MFAPHPTDTVEASRKWGQGQSRRADRICGSQVALDGRPVKYYRTPYLKGSCSEDRAKVSLSRCPAMAGDRSPIALIYGIPAIRALLGLLSCHVKARRVPFAFEDALLGEQKLKTFGATYVSTSNKGLGTGGRDHGCGVRIYAFGRLVE